MSHKTSCACCNSELAEHGFRCPDALKAYRFMKAKQPHFATKECRDATITALREGGLNIGSYGEERTGEKKRFFLEIDEIDRYWEREIREGRIPGVVWHDENNFSAGSFTICPTCAEAHGHKCPTCKAALSQL